MERMYLDKWYAKAEKKVASMSLRQQIAMIAALMDRFDGDWTINHLEDLALNVDISFIYEHEPANPYCICDRCTEG